MPRKKTGPPDWYDLPQVAALFKTSRNKIKARCAKGDFDYIVTGGGRHRISRESILKHLPELEMKHNK